jgi:hypothetical protein
MFVCPEYRFIFLRTEKTASTSVSDALAKQLGGRGYSSRKYFNASNTRLSPVKIGTLQKLMPGVFGLPLHAPAHQVRRVLGRETFDSFYKFAVERNPWDRQVSLYFHRRSENGKAALDFDRDMSSPLYRLFHHTRLDNWSKYAIGDTIVADRVIRFENLAEELEEVWAEIGLKSSLRLGKALSQYRDEDRDYRKHYSDETRDLVAGWYGREIEAFGYSF